MGGFVVGVFVVPEGLQNPSSGTTKNPATKRPSSMCVIVIIWHRIIFPLKKCGICIETMAAPNFSRDFLEMFYGPISQEVQQRLRLPIRPSRRFDFEIVRNNFGEWLRVWKMRVPGGNRDLLKQKIDILTFAKMRLVLWGAWRYILAFL